MKRGKLRSIIKKVLVGMILVISLVTSSFTCKVYARSEVGPYHLKESSIVYKENQNITGKRVMIYHTHTLEDFIDGTTVVDAGEDLARKLTEKGYEVIHIKENFSKNYNAAYKASGEFLQGEDLSQYDLIIDYHRNALDSANTVNVWGNDSARAMFVYSKASANYDSCRNLGNVIKDNLEDGVYMRDYEYNHGIRNFNTDLSPNMLLLEAGNNNNNIWQIKRLNTHLVNSIDKCFKG